MARRPWNAAPRLNGYRTPGEDGPSPIPPPKNSQASAGLRPELTALHSPCDGPARGEGQASPAKRPADGSLLARTAFIRTQELPRLPSGPRQAYRQPKRAKTLLSGR